MFRSKYKYSGKTNNRPDNLTMADTGYEYFDIEKNIVSFWNGTEWIELSPESQEGSGEELEYIIKIDDSLSSVELTKSIQQQFDEAYELGYRRVTFPKNTEIEVIDELDGVVSSQGKNNHPSILMLHSSTEYDLNGAIIKIKPNNYAGYRILDLLLCEDTMVKNGELIGDRDNHDYDASISETHEHGHGVLFRGSRRCLCKNLKIHGFTGDGSYMGSVLSYYSSNYVLNQTCENGVIDSNGANAEGVGYRLTNKISLDSLLNEEDRKIGLSLKEKLYVYSGNPYGYGALYRVTKKLIYIAFYDEEENFIKTIKSYFSDPSDIPEGAKSFRVYIDHEEVEQDLTFMFRIGRSAENSFIEQCEIYNCRRQGVSVGGGISCGLRNSSVYNIRGTAPQACVDIEDGGHTTRSIIIEGNFFKDCPYGVICYDGCGHIVSNNHFEDMGIAMTVNATSGAVIENNQVFRSTVLLTGTTEAEAYKPQCVSVKNLNVEDSDEVRLNGNLVGSHIRVKNAKALTIDGALVRDFTIKQEIKPIHNFALRLRNCTVDNFNFILGGTITSSAEQLNVFNSTIKNSSIDATLCFEEKVIVEDSYFSRYQLAYQKNSDAKFLNCTIGDGVNPSFAISGLKEGNVAKILFDNCEFKQHQNAHVYGMYNFMAYNDVTYKNCCLINTIEGNLFRVTNNEKAKICFINCTLKTKPNGKFGFTRTDMSKEENRNMQFEFIDCDLINIPPFDYNLSNITIEDCNYITEE